MSNADNLNSTKISKKSNNLSKDENELVFHLMGRRCTSLCTTVAQVYLTEPPDCRWMKKATGALCFVKDNAKRSYYCRLFCLIKHTVMWEQEMYDTIEISKTLPYLLTFEGQVTCLFT
jgi:neural Wiskott-Aldrich syndrome protein